MKSSATLNNITQQNNSICFVLSGAQSIIRHVFRLTLRTPEGFQKHIAIQQNDGQAIICVDSKIFFSNLRQQTSISFDVGNADFFSPLPLQGKAKVLAMASERGLWKFGISKNQFVAETYAPTICIERILHHKGFLLISIRDYTPCNPSISLEVECVHRKTKQSSAHCPIAVKANQNYTTYIFYFPVAPRRNSPTGVFDFYLKSPYWRKRICAKSAQELVNTHFSFNYNELYYNAKFYQTEDKYLAMYYRGSKEFLIHSVEVLKDFAIITVEAQIYTFSQTSISYRAISNDGRIIPVEHTVDALTNIGNANWHRHTLTLRSSQLHKLFHGSRLRLEAVVHDGHAFGVTALRSAHVETAPYTVFRGIETLNNENKKSWATPAFDRHGFLTFVILCTESYQLTSIAKHDGHAILTCQVTSTAQEPLPASLEFSQATLHIYFEDGACAECRYLAPPETSNDRSQGQFLCALSFEAVTGRPFFMTLNFQGGLIYMVHPSIAPCTPQGWKIRTNPGEYKSWTVDSEAVMTLQSQQTRRQEILLKCVRFAAWLYKKASRRPVWLVGEYLSQTASDNGIAFFNFLKSLSCTPERFYYVATKECTQRYGLEKDNRVCIKDSLRHLWLFALAKKCFVSHSLSDVLPTCLHAKHSSNWKDVWYLQHGVIALKKIEYSPKTYNGKLKKFVISSELERSFLSPQLGKTLINTGLCRYDNLVSENVPQRILLIMPTWRDWLRESSFTETSFFKNYIGLLHSDDFLHCLALYKLTAVFVPHKFLRPYLSSLTMPPVIQMAQHDDVQRLIRQCSMLLTDYSSIAFDVAYLRKPVLFYWDDEFRYMHERGMYIGKQNLFGHKAYTIHEVVDAIHDIVSNNFTTSKEDNDKLDRLVQWRDGACCARLYALARGKRHA